MKLILLLSFLLAAGSLVAQNSPDSTLLMAFRKYYQSNGDMMNSSDTLANSTKHEGINSPDTSTINLLFNPAIRGLAVPGLSMIMAAGLSLSFRPFRCFFLVPQHYGEGIIPFRFKR